MIVEFQIPFFHFARGLMPMHGVVSCVAPGACVAGSVGMIQFPQYARKQEP